MKGKSFLGRNETAITLLSTPTSVEHAIALARTARDDGADGIALELNRFPVEQRTVENFRKIISSVQLPFMFTDYRCDIHYGTDDEARMDTLLKAAEAGADVIDVSAEIRFQYHTEPLPLGKRCKCHFSIPPLNESFYYNKVIFDCQPSFSVRRIVSVYYGIIS